MNKKVSKIEFLVSAIVHDHGGSTGKGCHMDGGSSGRRASETPAAVVAVKAAGQQ